MELTGIWQNEQMIAPYCKLSDLVLNLDPFWDSIDQILVYGGITIRLFFHFGPEVSTHNESNTISRDKSADPRISFDINNLGIEQSHDNRWIFHDRFPFIAAFFELLKTNIFKIDTPISIQLLLPLLQ